MTTSRPRPENSKTTRIAGVCFFVATVCFLTAGIGLDQPLMLVAAGCNLVAWYVFITRANQLERKEGQPE
ncbi:MAG: hypothetical protein CMJ94_11960 [Planctomycetes bacterium]|nr:hypothetical protein [Planctomycetota bacterium]